MNIAVPRESAPNESRVALVPEGVSKLCKLGISLSVQSGAGEKASFPDELYRAAGATIVADAHSLLADADAVVKVGRPSALELHAMHAGAVLVAFLSPLGDPGWVRELTSKKITALSMDAIPRISRAQSMDALSSQSNIAGYKAVLLAAAALPKFFPMLTTAAGTIPPAKVLVLGAGVAGLQAIATARRLGAVVSAYDTRAVVKEQVMSLGAAFLELDLGVDAQGAGGYAKELSAQEIDSQRRFMVQHIGASDVVITTALVPGKPAPVLITQEAVSAMKPGSVIVDLAAEAGGNCALTKPAQIVVAHGVTIIGLENLASSVPHHASQLYSRNVFTLLTHLLADGNLTLDFNDEITRGACLTHDGEIMHELTLSALAAEATTA
ncbi:MAG: Re/Si-specific NAD(P)(+) transhydrogenase subunit alpha [Candidatus Eremiobacteraeota bacterium]|nr:Re/Si-specific NAD(P)(+) transhydrogenase subunit alpha [Candidatus Eremiobacteraeota bacterium]